jgi:osmotically-inducible protein OsmY
MRHHTSLTIAYACAATLFAAPATMAQNPARNTSPPTNNGARQSASANMLEDRVFVRLAEHALVGANVKIQVQSGIVTIGGTVPNDVTRQRVLRTIGMTPGVQDVRDQLRLNPAAAASRNIEVDDNELSKRVAETIARAIPGAKAGVVTGGRVEGAENRWYMVVHSEDGRVLLGGEVPRLGIIRDAVTAALQVPGVQSVRSDIAVVGSPYAYDATSGYPAYGSDLYGYAYWARQSAWSWDLGTRAPQPRRWLWPAEVRAERAGWQYPAGKHACSDPPNTTACPPRQAVGSTTCWSLSGYKRRRPPNAYDRRLLAAHAGRRPIGPEIVLPEREWSGIAWRTPAFIDGLTRQRLRVLVRVLIGSRA